MRSTNIRTRVAGLCLGLVLPLLTTNSHADVEFGNGATVFDGVAGTVVSGSNMTFSGDYTVPAGTGVLVFHRFSNGDLTVNGGSTLEAGNFLSTFTDSGLIYRADILVDGPGSRIQLGTDGGQFGNVFLRGKGDFVISNGATVGWNANNSCSGADLSCDVLIGVTGPSNTGIVVSGTGSLLDASTTNGNFLVGFNPSLTLGESEDFLVAENGGTILSGKADVATGISAGWDPTMGYVQATALVDNGSWNIQSIAGSGNDSSFDIGEGSGATGNVFVVNGGAINITGNPSQEGGFYLGQTDVGAPTEGGTNLLGIRGPGSVLSADNNSGVLTGSRIANGFVTVQENGALELDSSVLVVSGKTGQALETYNTSIAFGPAGFSTLGSANLDVRTGGTVTLSDDDAVGITALIIGQTPAGAGDTQSADVEVASGGSITVTNDPSQPKIALDATAFGLPAVSNIGTGTMMISDGSLTLNNGDFVIGVELEDAAEVLVNSGGVIAADRVVVGWADFELGGPGVNATLTGELVLSDGTIDADVYIDDNGELSGVGTINGALVAEGGMIDPGFSPGTIIVESFVLGAGSELVMELALNADGSVNASASDAIVATAGSIDLSGGTVMFELSSADPALTVEDIVTNGAAVDVTEVFESPEPVVVGDFDLMDPSGSISPEELEQQVTVVSFEKRDCLRGGWRDLARPDGTGFRGPWDCVRYIQSSNIGFQPSDCRRGGWRDLTRTNGTGFRSRWACIAYARFGH